MPRPEKVRLGEILLQQGLLTEAQLKEALDEQRKSGRKLGRVFVESISSPKNRSPRRSPGSCRFPT
jgi:hypothetical protein